MNDRKLTGEALLYAMEGIPDEILERSEEAAYGKRPVYRRKRRWMVTAGRLAAAAAALLLVLAGRSLLLRRKGSVSNSGTVSSSADYEKAESMEDYAAGEVRTGGAYGEPAAAEEAAAVEEAAGVEEIFETEEALELEEAAGTTMMIGAAGADTGEEAGAAGDTAIAGKNLERNSVTSENFVQRTAGRIAEACRQTLDFIKNR